MVRSYGAEYQYVMMKGHVTGITGVRWGFERASEPLLKMYRHAGEPVEATLLQRGAADGGTGAHTASNVPSAGQNALASALTVISAHACQFQANFRCRPSLILQND